MKKKRVIPRGYWKKPLIAMSVASTIIGGACLWAGPEKDRTFDWVEQEKKDAEEHRERHPSWYEWGPKDEQPLFSWREKENEKREKDKREREKEKEERKESKKNKR